MGDRYVLLVVFGCDYLVNIGRSEAEGFCMEVCHDIVDELMIIIIHKLPFFRNRSGGIKKTKNHRQQNRVSLSNMSLMSPKVYETGV